MLQRERPTLISLLALVIAAFSFAGCSGTTTATDPGKDASKPGALSSLFSSTKPITIPEGTALSVVLDQSVSSADSHAGDTFDATVIQPVVIGGKTVIPKDARAKGRVVDAHAAGHLEGVPRLELALDSVEVGGKSYDIQTNAARRSGQNHNKHNLIFIGGGTAAGALVGGVAGGGKGALIGSLIGAGGGTAAAAATGKKDIHLPAETRLTFQLEQPVTIQVKS